jgi:hypothetical protein
MTARIGKVTRPPLQTCPLCGLAMIAHKSRPEAAAYDVYECLACESELRLSGERESARAHR